MQTCDHKAACRAGTGIPLTVPCQREIADTIADCPVLVPMLCGHQMVYRRWTDEGTHHCAKCEEESSEATAV